MCDEHYVWCDVGCCEYECDELCMVVCCCDWFMLVCVYYNDVVLLIVLFCDIMLCV